jgi:uncharacterized protein YjiS (DUF1127 family)
LASTAQQNVADELIEASNTMAYVNTTRAVRKGLLADLKDMVVSAIQARRVYTRTVTELNALSDRELNDLGISRISIPAVAREAAYGK